MCAQKKPAVVVDRRSELEIKAHKALLAEVKGGTVLKPSEFIDLAVYTARANGQAGCSWVWGGVRDAFVKYFGGTVEDARAALDELVKSGEYSTRPVKGQKKGQGNIIVYRGKVASTEDKAQNVLDSMGL